MSTKDKGIVILVHIVVSLICVSDLVNYVELLKTINTSNLQLSLSILWRMILYYVLFFLVAIQLSPTNKEQ